MPNAAFTDRRYLFTLLAILLALTGYRLFALAVSGLNLYVDEAQYWSWSQALAWGYYSKPPVIAAIIAATTALFGHSEVAVKSGALLIYPLTSLLLFALGQRLYNARTGFWAALLFVTVPGVAFSSLIISTDVALFLFWTAALYCLHRALTTQEGYWWVFLGIACGLGLLTKYTMGIFGVSALLYCALSPLHRPVLRSPGPYAAMAIAGLLFLPNLLWNAHHGWPTFHHTADISNLEGGAHLHWGELKEFFVGQLGIFGPILFIALLGMAVRVKQWWPDDRQRFLALFSLPFLLLIAAQALAGRANANWAAMTYAAASLWVAARLLPGHKHWLVASLVLHLVLASVAYHYHALARAAHIPLTRKTDFFKRVQGWDTLGKQVNALLQAHPQTWLLTNERDTMSELLFYARPLSAGAVMWNPEGSVHNHYELSTTLSGKGDRSFIFVSRDTQLPQGMAESFLNHRDLGPLTVNVVPGWTLAYHATLLEGYMGYPLWLTHGVPR